MIKQATKEDKNRIIELWQLCFHDPLPWMEWYFEKRFLPARTLCYWRDNKIVSNLQLKPYPLKIRDTNINALCVSGVATDPAYRGKGYMGELFMHLMENAQQQRIPLLFNKPQNANIYEKFDHLYFTEVLNIDIKLKPKEFNAKYYSPDVDSTPLFKCYKRFASHYSGIVARTPALFKLRLEDILADNGTAMYLCKARSICGYCLYAMRKNYLECIEAVYDSQETLLALIDNLSAVANGKKISLSLPADALHLLKGLKFKAQLQPMNVLRVLDAAKLLQTININIPYTIGIRDKFLDCNNGVFTSLGERTDKHADIETDIGHFGQWISGYASVHELANKGCMKIHNSTALTAFDEAFPKCSCYAFETY